MGPCDLETILTREYLLTSLSHCSSALPRLLTPMHACICLHQSHPVSRDGQPKHLHLKGFRGGWLSSAALPHLFHYQVETKLQIACEHSHRCVHIYLIMNIKVAILIIHMHHKESQEARYINTPISLHDFLFLSWWKLLQVCNLEQYFWVFTPFLTKVCKFLFSSSFFTWLFQVI